MREKTKGEKKNKAIIELLQKENKLTWPRKPTHNSKKDIIALKKTP